MSKKVWLPGAAAVLLVVLGLLAGLIFAPDDDGDSDDLEESLHLYAAAQLFNGQVLASSSATASLQQWCAEHRLAREAKIVAEQVPGADNPVTDQLRQELKVGADEVVKYRKVRLMCGDKLLSEAENWYVPSRLTAEMNQQLETTTTPFGTAVKPLSPTRTTLSATFPWRVLPEGWEKRDDDWLRKWADKHEDEQEYRPGRTLFVHDAVLTRASDALPISRVRENYKQGLLAFLD